MWEGDRKLKLHSHLVLCITCKRPYYKTVGFCRKCEWKCEVCGVQFKRTIQVYQKLCKPCMDKKLAERDVRIANTVPPGRENVNSTSVC
jgi:hypothetical protein